jgi:ABC-type nitrate/sulfonate/bicarbonate transport system permease component
MKRLVWPTAFGIGLVLIWESYVRLADVDPLLLPPPSDVAAFFGANLELFLRHGFSTLTVILGGFVLGALGGWLLGILMIQWRPVREAVYPWAVASQMIPIPALAPVLVLWFGFTFWAKLFVVALICFFPVAVNTIDGLRRVDRESLALLRTLGASRWQELRIVSLPASLAAVFSGLRVAMALAIIAAVFGEWVGSRSGLGMLMLIYNNQAQTAGLFAAIGVLTSLGLLLFWLVGWLERRFMPWRRVLGEFGHS